MDLVTTLITGLLDRSPGPERLRVQRVWLIPTREGLSLAYRDFGA